MIKVAVLGVALISGLVTACTHASGPGVTESPQSTSHVVPSVSKVRLPTSTWTPGPSASYMGAILTGTLVVDNKNCLALQEPDGRRITTLWPAGYSIVQSGARLALADQDGAVVALAGRPIRLIGGFTSDFHSQPCVAQGVTPYEVNKIY